jgi:hypothetical protein
LLSSIPASPSTPKHDRPGRITEVKSPSKLDAFKHGANFTKAAAPLSNGRRDVMSLAKINAIFIGSHPPSAAYEQPKVLFICALIASVAR